jgi:hypothetical protein
VWVTLDPMSGFAAFSALVLADPALQAQLRAETDWDAFAALASDLAAERGCELSAGDLVDARQHARRAWIERPR